MARSQEIVAACRFSLDELRYDYPIDPPPDGLTVQQHLERLTWKVLANKHATVDGNPGVLIAVQA